MIAPENNIFRSNGSTIRSRRLSVGHIALSAEFLESSMFKVSSRLNAPNSERKLNTWIKFINKIDPSGGASRSIKTFRQTFQDPSERDIAQLIKVFPRLENQAKYFVVTELPEYVNSLFGNLDEFKTIEFIRSLTCDEALALVFIYLEHSRVGVPNHIYNLLEPKMRKETPPRLLKLIDKYLAHSKIKDFYHSLSFELKFLIMGHSEDRHFPMLSGFWMMYKNYMNEFLEQGVKVLSLYGALVNPDFFKSCIKLMDDQQRLLLLPVLSRDLFRLVKEIYIGMFDRLAMEGLSSQDYNLLRWASGPELPYHLMKIKKGCQSEAAKELFYKNDRHLAKYIKSIRTKSGRKHRKKLIEHMMNNQDMFSFYLLFKKLSKKAAEDPFSRETRRIILFCYFFLIENPKSVFVFQHYFKEILQLKTTSERSQDFLRLLEHEYHCINHRQFAHDLIDLLNYETEEISHSDLIARIMLSHTYFTETKVMIAVIIEKLQIKSDDNLYKLLTYWLKYIATSVDYRKHKNQLLLILQDETQAQKHFQIAFSAKELVSRLASDLSLISPGSYDKVSFDSVLTKAINQHKYKKELSSIATDLRNLSLEYFSSISYEEFSRLNWLDFSKNDSSIKNMINEANNLTMLVSKEILNPNVSSEKRSRIIEFFIDLCQAVYDLGDFHSSYAIYSALESTQVTRLKVSQSLVNAGHKRTKKNLDRLLDMSHNFTKVRKRLNWLIEHGRSFCPSINFLIQDLIAITENRSKIDFHHLNYGLFWSLSGIFKEFQKWQRLCLEHSHSPRKTDIGYSLDNIKTCPDLWKLSQECEPRNV